MNVILLNSAYTILPADYNNTTEQYAYTLEQLPKQVFVKLPCYISRDPSTERNYPRKFTNYKCINGNNKSPVNIPDRAICASLTDPEVDQIKLKLYGELSMRSIVPL